LAAVSLNQDFQGFQILETQIFRV